MKAVEYGSLIRGITSNMNEYIGNCCEVYGIKSGQFEYFILIFMTPGINQLEISKIKNVGKASVTKALKQLEKKNLIARKIDPKDRRNIRCYISDEGLLISDNLMKISSEIESKLFLGFSNNDMSAFYHNLKKLEDNSKKLLDT